MVILDTNIIIDHLRQIGKVSILDKIILQFSQETLAISIISIQELFEGRSTSDKTHEQVLLTTITSFKILPYTYEVAKKAGEIARDISISIGFADAAIAATAIVNDYQLYTLNKKDFRGIKKLELI